MNRLHIGTKRHVKAPHRGFLFIHHEVPKYPFSKVFDPQKSSFNPFDKMDHIKARNLADAFYAPYPQGENTLKVRDGKRALIQSILTTTDFEKLGGNEEIEALRDDILISPVIRNVFTNTTKLFNFNLTAPNFARIDRAELGTHDALLLTLALIACFKGQIVIPDFGVYGRETHIDLIEQNRLIAGLNYLNEVPEKLRDALLLIKHKTAHGALYEDALTLARFTRLRPDPLREDNKYNRFIDAAIA